MGIRDCFVEAGFNSLRGSDPSGLEHLEQQWGRVEDAAIPAIAAAEQGDTSENVVGCIKSLAAMHFVRSYTLRDFARRAIRDQRAKAPDYEKAAKVVDAFKSDFRRSHRPGEIEALVLAKIDDIEVSNLYFVNSSVRLYGEVTKMLEPMPVTFVRPATRIVGFLTSDTPLVVAQGIRVGVRGGVPIGQAESLYMPLGRWLGACFGDALASDLALAPWQVQTLNHLMHRSCDEWLAAHPAENIPRALAKSAPLDWPPDDQVG